VENKNYKIFLIIYYQERKIKKCWPQYFKDAEKHNSQIKKNDNKIIVPNNSIKHERFIKGRSNSSIRYNFNEIINIKNLKKEFRKSTKKNICYQIMTIYYINVM